MSAPPTMQNKAAADVGTKLMMHAHKVYARDMSSDPPERVYIPDTIEDSDSDSFGENSEASMRLGSHPKLKKETMLGSLRSLETPLRFSQTKQVRM